jgi:hypothetical protein
MIDLALYLPEIDGKKWCRCSQVGQHIGVGFLQITLLVCGLLAYWNVGLFQGISQGWTIGFLAGSGAFFALDLVLCVHHYLAERKKQQEDAPVVAKMTLTKQSGTGHYLLDMSKAFGDGTKPHLYPVFPYNDLAKMQREARPGVFFLYFLSDKCTLENVRGGDSSTTVYTLGELVRFVSASQTFSIHT